MTDMQYRYGLAAFVDFIENPINMGLLSVQEIANRLVFRRYGSATRMALKGHYGFFQPIEPNRCPKGCRRLNVFVDTVQIPQGAAGQPNLVYHACAGRL